MKFLPPRERYIAYNMILWVAVAVFGACVMLVAHEAGKAMVAHEEGWILLDEALARYEQGAYYECQRSIRRAMTTHEDMASTAVMEFGDRLINLPYATKAIRDHLKSQFGDAEPPEPGAIRALALLALYDADYQSANALLRKLDPNDSPEPLKWQARIALHFGDIHEAKRYFEAYWVRRASARKAVAARYAPEDPFNPSQRYDQGRMLFNCGLWEEAFEAFQFARTAGAQYPELRYFDGVAAELADRRDVALKAYSEVLDERPTHLPTLRRLDALFIHRRHPYTPPEAQ